MPATPARSYSKHSAPRSRRLEDYDDSVLRLIRGLCREAEYDERRLGRVTMAEICTAVEEGLGIVMPSRAEAGPIRRLLNDGALVEYRILEGLSGLPRSAGSYTYRASVLDDLNLAVILDLARTHVNSSLELRAGRKATAAGLISRRVLEITDSQLAMIEIAIRGLVEHLIPACRARPGDTPADRKVRYSAGLRAITADQLAWSAGAGVHGSGDWAILVDAERAYRTLSRNTRDRYVGAIRTLLDLGATHGYLLQADMDGAERTVVPTAWAGALEKWRNLVRERASRSTGTAQLSRIMSALAKWYAGSFHEIDPLRLTKEQSESFVQWFTAGLAANRRISTHHRSATLTVLRALMDAGVLEHVSLNECDRRRIRGRKNAFSTEAYKAIAREFDVETRDLNADYGLFQALGKGGLFDPENMYSLPRLVDWYTLRSVRHRKAKGMSAIDAYPRERVRGNGGLSGRPWTRASLEIHLELIGMYLGYLVRYHAVDLNSALDARHLFTEAYLVGFIDAVEEDEWTTPHRALDIIYHVSLYCSPCWESSAAAEGEQGTQAADCFQRLADYAAGRGSLTATGWDGLTLHSSQADEWGVGRSGSVELQRQRAEQVQRAYEEATGEPYAYIAMLRLRNAMITRFAREMGVDELEQLQHEIEAGRRRLSVSEFATLRDIRMWADALAAPNRRTTIAAMDTSYFCEGRGGDVWVQIPARKMKVPQNGDYQIKVGTRGATGDARYRMDLRDCYDIARAQYLGDTQTDALYVSTQNRQAPRDLLRLAPESITACYRRILEYGAEEMGIDARPMLALTGLASSHAHRHAVGSYFVAERDMLELARRMLHHRGIDTLLKVYARGKSDRSAESVMADVEL